MQILTIIMCQIACNYSAFSSFPVYILCHSLPPFYFYFYYYYFGYLPVSFQHLSPFSLINTEDGDICLKDMSGCPLKGYGHPPYDCQTYLNNN